MKERAFLLRKHEDGDDDDDGDANDIKETLNDVDVALRMENETRIILRGVD